MQQELDADPVLGEVEDLDVTADVAKWIHDNGYDGASVTFEAEQGPASIETVGDVSLELTYYVPELRKQSGTVTIPGEAPLVSATGNTTLLHAQGATYAPEASMDLALNNVSESVLKFGVVLRSLDIFETASFSFTGPVIELPGDTPGFGLDNTTVRLQVYLCPEVTSGCTPGTGRLALTSRVNFEADDGDASDRDVTVLSWSHTR